MYSQSVGISANGDITITVDEIIWHNTPITVSQDASATVSVQNELVADPLFVDPASGDYHIVAASLARDAGNDVGVSQDMDWQMRPMGWGPDIGADEYDDNEYTG